MFNWLKREKSAPNGAYKHGNTHLIDMHSVVKTYKSAAGTFTALKGVDLQVDGGEFVAIIGKSGSGKSTLINMLTGIDRPSTGEVLVGDTAVHKLNEGKMAAWRGRNVGVVFQFFQLLPTLTVMENIMLPMDFCNMYNFRKRKERALHLLDQVGMADQARKLPSTLSGGQQQRVAIARSLANDPAIIVADEPTGNLDSKTAEAVFRLFEGLVAEGKTIVMVTHDNDLAKRVTRTVILVDGEIVEEYLAKAFPTLTEQQLLYFSNQLETLHYAPGTVVIRQGEAGDKFYLVTKGRVEVAIEHDGQEIIVSTLTPGQFFGEMALLRGGTRQASVRADPNTDVELVALPRVEFDNLLAQSDGARQEVERMVEVRAENIATVRSNGHRPNGGQS
jgi:putative ABC transport system ATP-binding protein